MKSKIQREYLILIGAIVVIFGGSALAMWAGLLTNAKIQIHEATCESIKPAVIKSYAAAPVSAWKTSKTDIADITETMEAASFKSDTGEILERRCRGTGIMTDGSHVRISYKIYEFETKTSYIAGTGQEGERRVFRKD